MTHLLSRLSNIQPILGGIGMALLLCGAGVIDTSEPNATTPDGLPVGPQTPDSDNKDLPSAFSGQEAGYEKEPGTAPVKQYGHMQVQPMNVPGPGITLTCRDNNSAVMGKSSISTQEIDTSWEVYVNPDTNQGGTLIHPIRRNMNPPASKDSPQTSNPDLPVNAPQVGPNNEALRFAFNLKSMPAVMNNSLSLNGPVWCGPFADTPETTQTTVKIEIDRTTGKLLNPNMTALTDGWTVQWSQP